MLSTSTSYFRQILIQEILYKIFKQKNCESMQIYDNLSINLILIIDSLLNLFTIKSIPYN